MDNSKRPTDEQADRGADPPSAAPSAVAFPAGLLGCAVAFDVIAWLGGGDTMALVAYRMMAVGILSAVALAVVGRWRDRRVAAPRHAGSRRPRGSAVDVVVVLLFVASWLLRRAHDGLAPPAALWLAFAGAALALLAAVARGRERRPADTGPAAAKAGSTGRPTDTADFTALAPPAALTLPPTGSAS